MLERGFKENVILAKNDGKVLMDLLDMLNPLIKAYTRKLFFLEGDDARQEIIIAIIEAVKGIPKCESDGQCLAYIENAVKFKFAYLCKKNIKKQEIEDLHIKELDNTIYHENYADVEIKYDMELKRNRMTFNQKKILDYLILEYTDSEISDKLGISRQYINRIKKKFI